MKRIFVGLALVGLVAAMPAAAQLNSMPVFVSPKGGTGLTFAGSFGRGINSDSRKNTAFAARAALGVSLFSIGVGVGTVNPTVGAIRETEVQYMGNVALRIIGGPLVPVAVNIHAGVGYLKQDPATVTGSGTKSLNVPIGLGFGLSVPTPGFSVEPWVAPRVNLMRTEMGGSTGNQIGLGLSGGINLGFATGLGVHAAIDWTSLSAGDLIAVGDLVEAKPAILGIGFHYTFSLPGLGVPMVPGV